MQQPMLYVVPQKMCADAVRICWLATLAAKIPQYIGIAVFASGTHCSVIVIGCKPKYFINRFQEGFLGSRLGLQY